MSTGGQGALLSCFDEAGNWVNNGEGMLKPLWAYGETLDNLDFRLESPAVNIILDNEGVGGVYAKAAAISCALCQSDGARVRVDSGKTRNVRRAASHS